MIKNYSPIIKKIDRIGVFKSALLFVVLFFFLSFNASAQADLSIEKTVDNPNPKVGEEITFTITITNSGPQTATGVQITDQVRSGYTNIINISNGGNTVDNEVVWSDLTVPFVAGDPDASKIVLTLGVTVERDGEYDNRVQITASDQPDPDSDPAVGFDVDDLNDGIADDDESALVSVNPEVADLSITKTVSNATPQVGERITFTISVSNAGPDTATNVYVEDLVPSGYKDIVSIANGGGLNPSDYIVWGPLTIAPNQTVDLTFSVVVQEGDSFNNRAEIVGSDQLDPDSSVDQSFDVDDLGDGITDDDETDYVIVSPQQADLLITKEVEYLDKNLVGGRPHKGTDVVFTITVSNNGPTGTTNVTVKDLLPSGFVYKSDDAAGNYDSTTGIWTIGDMVNGAVETLNITAIISNEENYTNTASVETSRSLDLDTSNNTASVTVDPLEFFVPQAFSPNGDGKNDTFEFPGLGYLYPNFKLEIYTRWGNKVYDYSNNGNTSPTWWNGYSSGNLTLNKSEQLPTGTYYYVLYFNQDNLDPISNWVYLNR